MSGPSPRSIRSSTIPQNPAPPSSLSRPICPRSSASATASSSCAQGESPARSRRARHRRSTRKTSLHSRQDRSGSMPHDGPSQAKAASAAASRIAAAQETKRQRLRLVIRAAGMLPVLLLLCVGFHFLSDSRFFTGQNLGIVLQQAAVNTVLAAGMTFVILTGGIDLSVGSILAAAAMAGLTMSKLPDLGALWLPAAVLTGLGFGVINGALIALLRLPPFIVTLGSLTAVRGLARLLGADTTVFNPSIPYAFIGNGSLTLIPGVASIPWLSVIALLVILVSWLVLRRTVLGVHLYAVGGNESAARLAGIKVWAVLIFVYGVSGLLAGLGGAMQAARLYAANGLQLGQSYELDAITAVILGGTSFVGGIGSIWGTLVGALIIAVLSNGLILTGVSDVWQYVIKGLVIIGAVALDRYRLQGSART